MAISLEGGVKVVTVDMLLLEPIIIPPYQRPYAWTPKTALQLLDDITDARREVKRGHSSADDNGKRQYVLGTVILHKDASGRLNVVDGQQRLITLNLLRKVLSGNYLGQFTQRANPAAPISQVLTALAARTAEMSPEDRGETLDFLKNHCELIRIETDDTDEAFRVFDSQNYRGKALLPHDLLKAYHLREMRSETNAMKIAFVEGWERVPDRELDRLFSTYLWPIKCWARGESAPKFSAVHVDAFKGLSAAVASSPFAYYHAAAQRLLSIMPATEANDSEAARRIQMHSRFQIDAPILAGRTFFEMVTFMLAELKNLRNEDFISQDYSNFASSDLDLLEISSKSKYRYLTELYMAAILFYRNKFGESKITEARKTLFRWAYNLRIQREKVQYKSVDNRARGRDGHGSAFITIRNAVQPSDLRVLQTRVEPNANDNKHEKALYDLILELD